MSFGRLIYTGTADESHTVGAYILAGDDGTEIGHVSDALKVDIGSVSDLDIRDLIHTSDSVALGDGSANLVTVTNNGADYGLDVNLINDSIVVTATQLDIDDLNATDDAVAAWVSDGSGNAIGSTAGALDVNIASGDIDDSLANTDFLAANIAGAATDTDMIASDNANRKWLLIANETNKTIYLDEDAATTAGFPVHPGSQLYLRCGGGVDMHFIGQSGITGNVHYAEMV